MDTDSGVQQDQVNPTLIHLSRKPVNDGDEDAVGQRWAGEVASAGCTYACCEKTQPRRELGDTLAAHHRYANESGTEAIRYAIRVKAALGCRRSPSCEKRVGVAASPAGKATAEGESASVQARPM